MHFKKETGFPRKREAGFLLVFFLKRKTAQERRGEQGVFRNSAESAFPLLTEHISVL